MSACGLGEGASESLVSRVDSMGVEVLVNHHEDQALGWTFRESWRVGGADEGAEAFFQVRQGGVATDAAGRIYVLDAGNHRVSVWDSSGVHLRSFGRQGDGPGELSFPLDLAVSPDGYVAVYDPAKAAPVEYAPNGEPVTRSRSLPGQVFGVRYGERGLVFVKRSQQGDRVNYGLLAETDQDTVRLAELELDLSAPLQLETCGVGLPGMPRIFDPVLRWTALRGDIVLSLDASYSVRWISDGELRRLIRRDLPRRAATNRLALQELGEGMRLRMPAGEVLCAPEEVLEQRGVAAEVPLIESLHLAPEYLWVVRSAVGSEPRLVDVFDSGGEYLGTLVEGTPEPSAFLPDGRVVSLETDELDVQWIVVYEIARDEG